MPKIAIAVLTISDSCHQDASKDRSGPRLVELIKDSFENAHILTEILPDECDLIKQKLQQLTSSSANDHAPPAPSGVSLIITTGGTGFAPRDVTPEATRAVIDKECPQLMVAIALASLEKTKFAVLSRGVCGIAKQTLILNFPGSEKAVVECYEVVRDLLPHALQLINNELALVKRTHSELQQGAAASVREFHQCPHKTGQGDPSKDRNSQWPMLTVKHAMGLIFGTVQPGSVTAKQLMDYASPVDIPPFRASIKDGYAMKSSGFPGTKKVVGYIAAGDDICPDDFAEDECFKINTGAPLPLHADCVIQIEDTRLLKTKRDGQEDLVEILVQPQADLDIRPIGSDLAKGSKLFPVLDNSKAVIQSVLASVGGQLPHTTGQMKVAIVSTGSELISPLDGDAKKPGKIYDSNTTMLQELLQYFGFQSHMNLVLSDDYDTVKAKIAELMTKVDFIICTGGVSMGDKDYIKPILKDLGFTMHFGRVNMKPGKPMTFASTSGGTYFFGLPGNPVSAFVTFHLFVLPALRWHNGWALNKCSLSAVQVILDNESIPLDPRPEYMRATVTSRNGRLYASINGNQMSSRLQSIVGADVLVHLPARTEDRPAARAGEVFLASVLRYDFISKYD